MLPSLAPQGGVHLSHTTPSHTMTGPSRIIHRQSHDVADTGTPADQCGRWCCHLPRPLVQLLPVLLFRVKGVMSTLQQFLKCMTIGVQGWRFACHRTQAKKSVFCIMRQLHSAQHKSVLGKFLPQLCSHRCKQRCTRGFRRHQMASPARLLSVQASCWLLLAANTVTSAFSAAPGTTYCGTTRANAASDAIPQLQQQTHGQTQFWGQSGWFRHGAGNQVPNLP